MESIKMLCFLFMLCCLLPYNAVSSETCNYIDIGKDQLSVDCQELSLNTIFEKLEAKTGVRYHILGDVTDQRNAIKFDNLPLSDHAKLLQVLQLENYAIGFNTDRKAQEIYIFQEGTDINTVLKGKPLIIQANFSHNNPDRYPQNLRTVSGIQEVSGEKLHRAIGSSALHVASEVLIKVVTGTKESEITSMLDRHSLQRVQSDKVKTLEKLGYVKALISDERTVKDVMEELADTEYIITRIEPNYVAASMLTETHDPFLDMQWYVEAINYDKAWPKLTKTRPVVIAVVDSGIDSTHPDLKGRVVSGYDFVSGTDNATDDNGHGTFVSGIIAANANDIGIRGLNPYAAIMPVKVMDEGGFGTYENVASGIVYAADQGAEVINLSIGGYGNSSLLQDAVEYALGSGSVLVAAAGNDGVTEEVYPAAYPDVLAVGALGTTDTIWNNSNRGKYIGVVAPGTNIVSTGLGGTYVEANGTSASSAIVAALAATVIAENESFTAYSITQLIKQSSRDLGEEGFDRTYGAGAIDAATALEQSIEPFHDLSVSSIGFEAGRVKEGADFTIDVKIRNNGTFPEENVSVSLYRLQEGEKVLLAEEKGLKIETVQDITFFWLPEQETADLVFEAVVESESDSVPDNNQLKTTQYTLITTNDIHILYANTPPVHSWIALQAYNKLPDGSPFKIEMSDYLETDENNPLYAPNFGDSNNPIIDGWEDWWANEYGMKETALIEGAWEEDSVFPYEVRAIHHFWDNKNDYNDGFGLWDSAVVTAQERLKKAIEAYNRHTGNSSDNKAEAYYWLGRTAHLLMDMSVPAHTLNDEHPKSDPDTYETYTAKYYKDIDYQSINSEIPDSLSVYPVERMQGYEDHDYDLVNLFYSLARISDNFDSNDEDGRTESGEIGNGGGKYNDFPGHVEFSNTSGLSKVYQNYFGVKTLLMEDVDYEIIISNTSTKVAFYRERYDVMKFNALIFVEVQFSDGSTDSRYNLKNGIDFVPDSVCERNQIELQSRAIGYTAALYQLFWDKVKRVSLSPSNENFGNVDPDSQVTTSRSFQLTNRTSSPLSTTQPVILGENADNFVVSSETCTTLSPLAAGGSCAIHVDFAPTSTGSKQARLQVHTTDSVTSLLESVLTGGGAGSFNQTGLVVNGSVKEIPMLGESLLYELPLIAGQGYTFDLTAHLNSSSLIMRLYDNPNGSYLKYSSYAGNGETVRLSFTPTVSMTYYLKVVPSSSSARGNFDLGVYSAWFNPGVVDGDRSYNSTYRTAHYLSSVSYDVGANNSSYSWYRFTAQDNAQISISLAAHLNSGSLIMRLYDNPNGSYLKYSSYAGNGETVTLRHAAQQGGVYYLMVERSSSSTTGNYTLTTNSGVEPDQDSDGDQLMDTSEYYHGTDLYRTDSDWDGQSDIIELQHGSSPAIKTEYSATTSIGWNGGSTAKSLTADDRKIAVEIPGQSTWFKIDLQQGKGYTFDLTAHLNSSSLIMRLYDNPNGSYLKYSSYAENGKTVTLSYTPMVSMTYYLKVEPSSSSAIGNFDLGVYNAWFNSGVTDNQRGYNNTWRTARGTSGFNQTDNYSMDGRTLWYRLDLEQGNGYTFDLSAHLNSSSLIMRLYDNPDGSYLKYSSYAENGETVRLSYTPTVSMTYYLKVEPSSSSARGNFDLGGYSAWFNPGVVDDDRSYNSTYMTAHYLNSDSYQVGANNSSYSWYRFTAQDNAQISISLTAHLNSGSLIMRLYDNPNGSYLKYSSYAGNGETVRLNHTAQQEGVYYLLVERSSSSTTGDYTLNINSGVELDPDGAESKSFSLTVLLLGPGDATITGTTMTCDEESCSGTYPYGSIVTLSPKANSGSNFKGWYDELCSGTENCTVTITGDTVIAAYIEKDERVNITPILLLLLGDGNN